MPNELRQILGKHLFVTLVLPILLAVWLSGSSWAAEESKLPAGYKLVWAEDFRGDGSFERFEFSVPEHWKRVKVGDRYALEHAPTSARRYKPPHRSPQNIALIAARQFGSFVLEYEAQQTGKEYGHRDACVFFGFVDPANYYYTHIATKRDAHAHQIFTVDDKPRTAITKQGTSGFDWKKPDTWHKVRVVRRVETGDIEIYVNNMQEPIMVTQDKSHGPGAIGFGSFDDSGRVTNIRLYAANSKETTTKFFNEN